MDVYESSKALDKNVPTHRSRTREVSSRYKSPTPSSPNGPKRCPSPNVIRTTSTSNVSVSAPKRAVSVERKRPITPSPSTPVRDTTAEALLASNKTVINNKFPESLWPSTMRSLNNSFQSDALSVRTGKGEKTVVRKRSPLKGKNSDDQLENSKPVDILRHQWPSRTSVKTSTLPNKTDVTDKMMKSSSLSRPRMVTPSVRRLSLDGTSKPLHKSASELLMQMPRDDNGTERFCENSVDDRSVRVQRSSSSSRGSRPSSPSVCRGVSPACGSRPASPSTLPNKTDVTDKMTKSSSLSRPRMVAPSVRRLSLDGTSKPLQKSASDLLMQMSCDDSGTERFFGNSVDDWSVRAHRSSGSSRGSRPASPSVCRGVSPSCGSRPSSPSVSRGVSPSRAKPVNVSSRGTSPARIRPSSPSRNPQNSSSVLSFIADIKKGKRATNDIDDSHQLRLLYNRHLQWRFANARSDAALHSQQAKAERMLYNVWGIIVDLLEAIMEKRSDLQELKLKLKLCSVLDSQVSFLDEWTSMDRVHTDSLAWTIQDLQASTLRIPVTGGARADINTVKEAVCSAVDVMRSMGSSLCSTLSQVEEMNCLVSELADVAARERAMLDECESLLGSRAALQEEEYSLRTHLLQMQQTWKNGQRSVFGY